MPNRTIYIRNEDLDAWNGISDKPAFIHNALHWKQDSEILRTPKLHKQFDEVTKPHWSGAIPKSFSARKKK